MGLPAPPQVQASQPELLPDPQMWVQTPNLCLLAELLQFHDPLWRMML